MITKLNSFVYLQLRGIEESGFDSENHYFKCMKDFGKVLDRLDKNENISEEGKEKFYHYLEKIGWDGVFEISRNINTMYKETGLHERIKQRSASSKELSEYGRRGAEALGYFLWTEEDGSRTPQLDTLDKIVGASIGKGYHSNKPSWDYVTTKFNEETGLDLSKDSLNYAHREYNKNRTEE